MALKLANYKDEEGRLKTVLLPEEEPDANAYMGVPVGPPDLSQLGLSPETEVRLNNELFHRGVITGQDALRKRSDIVGAIQAALKLDAEKIVVLYLGEDYKSAKASEIKSDSPVQHRGPRQSRQRPSIPVTGPRPRPNMGSR